jgi:hypothetical protein
MRFSTQEKKDSAIAKAQKVVDASSGQALVHAEEILADTKEARVE